MKIAKLKANVKYGLQNHLDEDFHQGVVFVHENGNGVPVDGTTNEAVLEMLIDRIGQFQQTSYRCRENAIAITKLEEALMWLERRERRIQNGGS